ncbi:Ig-like domain-containing protein [Paraflavitalea sp. CAU 1676]|uniref:T9SS type A sorting domain-containing protein n=1 Tax=Paraflavitalea sp. CAU 1676 TaxID=3032598 RepID=UPI0023DB6855|nr:Ig-like domain-containing protein [Paraflavitalea sp. CAU 1676]MDF2187864.1 T9SS type A sorting domain-containing protein [Paraflavitalea sp. CAU 1676]
MKTALLLGFLLLMALSLFAQLEEDFTPNPIGWTLDQGAQFTQVSGNDVVVTPSGGGNNHARIGTPAVTKTSNLFKVCFSVTPYTSNLNATVSFPCATYMDVLFVKSSVATSNDAEVPANIYARVDNFLLNTNGGAHCFSFTFPPGVTAGDFKVFLSFHAACQQNGVKLVLDNFALSGVDEVCAGATCPPAALDDQFTRISMSELTFNAVLYGSNLNYPAAGANSLDAGGTDNDPNDTYAHLQWSLVTAPVNGIVVINANGTCTITRNSPAVNSLTFTYRLTDDGADNNFATAGDNLFDDATVTVAYTNISALPVVLTDFAVARQGSSVRVSWVTAGEVNNLRFEIERSMGGEPYQVVGTVGSKAVDGNSSTALSYEYADMNSSVQTAAYRLIQVDLDGRRTIYGAKSVKGMAMTTKMVLQPNPAPAGTFSLYFQQAGSRDILISDLGGKVIQRWVGYAQSSLSVTGLRNGLYLVQVSDRATMEKMVQKLVVAQ